MAKQMTAQAKGRAKKNLRDSAAARSYKDKDGAQGGGKLNAIGDEIKGLSGLSSNKKLSEKDKTKAAKMLGKNHAKMYSKTLKAQGGLGKISGRRVAEDKSK